MMMGLLIFQYVLARPALAGHAASSRLNWFIYEINYLPWNVALSFGSLTRILHTRTPQATCRIALPHSLSYLLYVCPDYKQRATPLGGQTVIDEMLEGTKL